MRAAIFDPYLDTLGGGERYVLSAAQALSEEGWEVDVQGGEKVLAKASERLHLGLEKVRAVSDIKRGDKYDLCFWLSDGSIPRLLARKNILHFQRPFYNIDGSSLINRMKFFRINKVVANSAFTKSWIDKEYPCESIILYPPVDTSSFVSKRKEDLIIYVGRFSQLEQSKRQDVLVDAFKRFSKRIPGWRLVLAGGSDVGRTGFVEELKRKAKNYPIEIVENADFSVVKNLFGRAKLYWSASGYGVNEKKTPEKVEHFGITVVEAMAAKTVPLVFNAGGHKEIITAKENGYLWAGIGELVKKSVILANDNSLRIKLAASAQKKALEFDYSRFKKKFLELI